MLFQLRKKIIFLTALLATSPASAERLFSLWRLDPVESEMPTEVRYGNNFLEQRLIPVKLAQITSEGEKSAPTGTKLYMVEDESGHQAFCTFKDMSVKNQAASFFMPVLDRRPCFVDHDNDGKLESSFSVFDKYGSMLTPSGNMNDTRPLAMPLSYREIDPHQVDNTMRIAFVLGGGKEPSRAKVELKFDKRGRGRWQNLVSDKPFAREGDKISALNALVTVQSVTGNQARVAVSIDPRVVVKGTSTGYLTVYNPPSHYR